MYQGPSANLVSGDTMISKNFKFLHSWDLCIIDEKPAVLATKDELWTYN